MDKGLKPSSVKEDYSPDANCRRAPDAKVEGVHGKVPFNGKGVIRIEGFKDDDAARRAGFPAWRMPGRHIPDTFTFIDDKAGPLVRMVFGNDMYGWHRAHKAGRLAKRNGVNRYCSINVGC